MLNALLADYNSFPKDGAKIRGLRTKVLVKITNRAENWAFFAEKGVLRYKMKNYGRKSCINFDMWIFFCIFAR
jgi:hypothetical protein